MKKLISAVIIIAIQYLTLNIQNSFAQSPNDNIGSGNCLDFDGTNNRVAIPHSASIDVTGPFTVEGWINNNATAGGDRDWLYKNLPSNATTVGFRFQTNGGGLVRFIIANGAGTSRSVTGSIPINEWHHLAGVYDGANIYLYIDGILIGTSGGAVIGSNTEPLYIGGFVDNNTYFEGQVDEVRMWDVAKTQAQIKENMCKQLQGNESNLVGYWNMNEGTGNTVGDLTSNNNDGARQ